MHVTSARAAVLRPCAAHVKSPQTAPLPLPPPLRPRIDIFQLPLLVPSLTPALAFIAAFSRLPVDQPLRTLIRTTGYKLRPPRPERHAPAVRHRQDAVFRSGCAGLHQTADVLRELRSGPTPTIVLGGFVPDATEQVFLLRGYLLRQGAVYYVNYPRLGFSLKLIRAQVLDLIEEITHRHGATPVLLGVSFGAGIVLDALRTADPAPRAAILVSPVACTADLIDPAQPKPTTLLGRAVRPCLLSTDISDPAPIEKARVLFNRMFDAGAQNKATLAALMTADEVRQLHQAVTGTIAAIDTRGAYERIRALDALPAPTASSLPDRTPTLALYAEKEENVLAANSPTRAVLKSAAARSPATVDFQVVRNPRGHAVQHASLVFHVRDFLPPIAAFYRRLKTRKSAHAA